jgi:hypothetical protein
MSRKSLVGLACLLASAAISSQAMALDNDLVLSRFATFDPQEYAIKDANGNITAPCVSACGTVKPNKQLFENLVTDMGQVIAPKIGSPAETLGEAGFALNFQTSLIFIPHEEEHWKIAVEDRDPNSSLFMGNLQVRKGLPFSFEVAGNFGYIFNSDMFTLGADLKWALNEGFYYFPDLAIRGSVNTLLGSPDLNLITAGGDMSLSKSFGISGVMSITPYVGYQMLFIVGSSRLLNGYPQDPRSPQFDTDRPAGEGSTTFSPEFVFDQYDAQVNRVFFGTRVNVWVLSFGLEGVIADVSQAMFSIGAEF